MNEIIYKILIYKEPKTFLDKILYRLFDKGKLYYWIEYRIDENRFWYYHKNGKKIDSHHTKNDLKGSLDIIIGIEERARIYGYNVEKLEYNITNYIQCNESISNDEVELLDSIFINNIN